LGKWWESIFLEVAQAIELQRIAKSSVKSSYSMGTRQYGAYGVDWPICCNTVRQKLWENGKILGKQKSHHS